MKKIYIKPITEQVEVSLKQVIAVSIVINNNYNGTAEIESRRIDHAPGIWDDDDYGQSDWLQ